MLLNVVRNMSPDLCIVSLDKSKQFYLISLLNTVSIMYIILLS